MSTATVENTTVAPESPVQRHRWTADEKTALVTEFEAASGDRAARAAVLAKFSALTGAQPQSVQATYYAAKAKAGSAVGQPRGARKPKVAVSANPILDSVNALVARKAEIEVALDPKGIKAMERELKSINRKLSVFA